MRPSPAELPIRRRNRTLAVAAAAVGLLAACPRPASALFGIGDVISDPWAQAKNAEKVAQMLLQLQQMAQQLQQLQAQVEDLGSLLDDPGGDAFGRAGQALDALTQVQQTLDRWQAELPADLDPQAVTIDSLPERNAQVRAYLRDRVEQAEASLAAVEEGRQGVTLEVASIVQASNAAAGPKAAQQAANQLQAVLAAERSKLQALRAMRGRLAADADAARQAQEAASEAVRQRELSNMRQAAEALGQQAQDAWGGND